MDIMRNTMDTTDIMKNTMDIMKSTMVIMIRIMGHIMANTKNIMDTQGKSITNIRIMVIYNYSFE